jgi:O-antigen/teichoic acid export membrane protein
MESTDFGENYRFQLAHVVERNFSICGTASRSVHDRFISFNGGTCAVCGFGFSVDDPLDIFARIIGPLMLTQLSSVQEDVRLFHRQCGLCFQIAAMASVLCVMPLIMCGEELVTLIFGSKFQGGGLVMAILAIASAFRFLRSAPTVAAMAKGDTKNQMVSNLIRAISLPLAYAALMFDAELPLIALCAVVGELAAFGVSVRLMVKNRGVPWAIIARPVWFVVGVLVISFGAGYYLIDAHSRMVSFTGCTVAIVLVTFIAWRIFPLAREIFRPSPQVMPI